MVDSFESSVDSAGRPSVWRIDELGAAGAGVVVAGKSPALTRLENKLAMLAGGGGAGRLCDDRIGTDSVLMGRGGCGYSRGEGACAK